MKKDIDIYVSECLMCSKVKAKTFWSSATTRTPEMEIGEFKNGCLSQSYLGPAVGMIDLGYCG